MYFKIEIRQRSEAVTDGRERLLRSKAPVYSIVPPMWPYDSVYST
jgi:hypothetical protein